jgi:hypothetical protein
MFYTLHSATDPCYWSSSSSSFLLSSSYHQWQDGNPTYWLLPTKNVNSYFHLKQMTADKQSQDKSVRSISHNTLSLTFLLPECWHSCTILQNPSAVVQANLKYVFPSYFGVFLWSSNKYEFCVKLGYLI